jgi:UDP-3-O-[3-hydroxymyristoyl] glucosamine N-acyltransferase
MKKISKTLAQLAELLNAQCQGDAQTTITGLGSLQTASTGQIAFLDNSAYRKYLSNTKASAVILHPDNASISPVPVLITKNPYLAYAKVAALFNDRPLPGVGVHPSVFVGKNCTIHPTASIGAQCVIGDNCVIGAECCLWPHVTLYDNTILGDRVTIHSGAVLGIDGFGNAREGIRWVKVPQLGRVVVGNDVEIGANTTIDRGALEDTVIEEGVRLDNQIQIAHNVRIGAHTAIAACVGIAGSTTIGKYCMIGGAVGISGHIKICDGVIVTGMSGIMSSITEPGVYSSTPLLQKSREWRKTMVRMRHLDELFDRVKRLEKTEA